MTKQTDSLDRLRIATPCSIGWEKMNGTEQVRFCEQCQLNVYNISGMTRKQAVALITQTEGRICARFYRRTDGTILTRDCPVGLRALRRRMARIAGAAATALMSFCLSAVGQTPAKVCKPDSDKKLLKLTRTRAGKQAQNNYATLSGKLTDPMGAVVPGFEVVLTEARTKTVFKSVTNDSGDFQFPLLGAGSYTLEIEPKAGFKGYKRTDIAIHDGDTVRLDVTLTVVSGTVTVGIVAYDNLIDVTRPGGTTVITGEMIQKLPFED